MHQLFSLKSYETRWDINTNLGQGASGLSLHHLLCPRHTKTHPAWRIMPLSIRGIKNHGDHKSPKDRVVGALLQTAENKSGVMRNARYIHWPPASGEPSVTRLGGGLLLTTSWKVKRSKSYCWCDPSFANVFSKNVFFNNMRTSKTCIQQTFQQRSENLPKKNNSFHWWIAEPWKNQALLSIESWLFGRDPYFMDYEIIPA